MGLCVAPALIASTVRSMIRITSPQSPIFEFWLNPDRHGVTTRRSFYLYNITNPLAIAATGEAPNIVVRGPFVYREVWTKDRASVRWYLNGTLGYRYQYHMFFEPALSIDAVTGRPLSEQEAITVANGPLRGTVYRVGRLPEVIVNDPILNITRPIVCDLLDALVNDVVLGPKGAFTQRTARELLWGYTDPIWNELHKPLSWFNYNASTYFQAQWNGSVVVPSPYTFRSGQMCPLWQDPRQCNNTGAHITLEVSGRTDAEGRVLLPEDRAAIAEQNAWNALLPEWMRRPELLAPESVADTTRYAGQLDGQWWWGPMQPGMTGGDGAKPDGGLPPVAAAPRQRHQQQQQARARAQARPPAPEKTGPGGVPDAACRRQFGTDGTRFAAPVTSASTLHIFNDLMGRTFAFAFWQKSRVRDGIETLRFAMDAVRGMRDSPLNRHCFQQRFYGLANVSQYVFGDGVVSKAMYLDSCVTSGDAGCVDEQMTNTSSNDPAGANDDGFTGRRLLFNVTFSTRFGGARYSLDEYMVRTTGGDTRSAAFRLAHETYADVLGLTGTTLSARARGQISLALGPIAVRGCNLSKFSDRIPRTLIPYLRLDRSADVGGAVFAKLEASLALITVAYALLGSMLAIGVIGALVSLVWLRRRRQANCSSSSE